MSHSDRGYCTDLATFGVCERCESWRANAGAWWLAMLGFALAGPAATERAAMMLEAHGLKNWDAGERSELVGFFDGAKLIRGLPLDDDDD